MQVLTATQLLLSSHPQPLCVVTQSGTIWPYQLHCAPDGWELLDEDELLILDGTLLELEGTEERELEEELIWLSQASDTFFEVELTPPWPSSTVRVMV